VFDHCWSFEKASLSVRVWNEMLVSNIRRNNLSKRASSFRKCYSNFWKERGEKLMTCHLFLDNFLRFYDLWVVFKGFKSFETDFVSRKLKYLNLVSWNVRLFWILSFAKDVFIAENWLCFRACNSRIVTYDQEFCHVGWFCALITFYEIFPFEKFSLRKSWCCRKHVFVFEIVSLRNLNKVDQIIFFP
jgi:hypothetical protein